MIEFYGLTSRGVGIAKNPRNPNTPAYRIISFLYKVPRAEKALIGEASGLNPSQTAIILRDLKSKGYVASDSEVNV